MGLEVLFADALAGGIGEAVAGDVLGGAIAGDVASGLAGDVFGGLSAAGAEFGTSAAFDAANLIAHRVEACGKGAAWEPIKGEILSSCGTIHTEC